MYKKIEAKDDGKGRAKGHVQYKKMGVEEEEKRRLRRDTRGRELKKRTEKPNEM